jgi:hypothetical protein
MIVWHTRFNNLRFVRAPRDRSVADAPHAPHTIDPMKFLLGSGPLRDLGGQLLIGHLEIGRALPHLFLEPLPRPQQLFLIAPLPASQPADKSSGEEKHDKLRHFAEREPLCEERRRDAIFHSKDGQNGGENARSEPAYPTAQDDRTNEERRLEGRRMHGSPQRESDRPCHEDQERGDCITDQQR